MCCGAVLIRAESIPESGGEQNHLGTSQHRGNAVEDVVIAELRARPDGVVREQYAEDPLLSEAKEDDNLENDDLDQASSGLHHGLHVAPELDNGDDAGADANGL